MNSPLVSIIIPVYNSEAYIGETIQSALDQTWTAKEIIVVNDGSTDNSYELAKKFKSKQVKVFTQENRGASAARNKGLREANGEFIQFLDGDDLLDSEKIARQMSAIGNEQFTLAYGKIGYFNPNQSISSVTPHSSINTNYQNGYDLLFDLYGGKDKKAEGGMVALHAWLTPRRLIAEAGIWNENLSVDDDGEFFCRVVLKAEQVKFVPEAIGYYRRHEHQNSLSSQKSYTAFRSALDAIKLKYQHIGIDNGMNALLANQVMHLLNDLYPAESKLCKEMQQFIDQLGGNTWEPYQEGVQKWLRILFGWRFVKLLSYYKNKRKKNHINTTS